MTKFGRDLTRSAKEALAIAQGRMKPARVIETENIDVAAIRKRMKLSQVKFAERFGFSPAIVRDWEQGRRYPDKMSAAYLKVIAREPAAVERALSAA